MSGIPVSTVGDYFSGRHLAAGRQQLVYLAFLPLAVLLILGFAYIINEEIFTGTMVLTMRPPAS